MLGGCPSTESRWFSVPLCLCGSKLETYGLSNFTVLTVAPSARRMHNLIDAHQRYTKGAVHPNLFLFIDHPSLLRSRDMFALPWVNGNGKQVRLVP